VRILVFAILLLAPALAAQEGGDRENISDPLQQTPPAFVFPPPLSLCEGDGCDAYLPILNRVTRFEDISAQRKWGAALGGLSGALIGEEVGGAPGAVALGVLGTFLGYNNIDRDRWERDAKSYDAAWQRGDDTYYNPANRLPIEAHWMHAGPARRGGDQQKK